MSRQILKYIVIEAHWPFELEQAVLAKIMDGFEPCGGVSIACHSDSTAHNPRYAYVQAMVIYGADDGAKA